MTKLSLTLLALSMAIGLHSMATPTSIGVVKTDASCPNSGSVTLTATGGTGSYTYNIVSGPTTAGSNTTGIFNTLQAGTYVFSATDGSGTLNTASITIANTYPAFSVGGSVSGVCTSYTPGGTITATASGGNPFSGGIYHWGIQLASLGTNYLGTWNTTTSGTSYSESKSAFGTYRVFVQDQCGEIRTHDVSLTATMQPVKDWWYTLILDRPCGETPASVGISGATATSTATLHMQLWTGSTGIYAADMAQYNGTKIEIYSSSTNITNSSADCSAPTLGSLMWMGTIDYNNPTGNISYPGDYVNIIIPTQDVIIKYSTPCGDVSYLCYNYNEGNPSTPTATVHTQVGGGCGTVGDPYMYNIDITQTTYFIYPVTASIDLNGGGQRVYSVDASGNKTNLVNSSAGSVWLGVSDGGPDYQWTDLVASQFPATVTLTDACGNVWTSTINAPPATTTGVITATGGNMGEVTSYCTDINGGGVLFIYEIDWSDFPIDAFDAYSGSNPVSFTITGGPAGSVASAYYHWSEPALAVYNVVPDSTYTLTATYDNGSCTRTATYTFTVPAANAVTYTHNLTATATGLCGSAFGDIAADAHTAGGGATGVYELWPASISSLPAPATSYTSPAPIATNVSGSFTSIPSGNYQIRWWVNNTAWRCNNDSFVIEEIANVEVPNFLDPLIWEKVTTFFCDGSGNAVPTSGYSIGEATPNRGPYDYEIATVNGGVVGAYSYVSTNDPSGIHAYSLPLSGDPLNQIYSIRVTDICGNRVTKQISLQPLDAPASSNTIEPCISTVDYTFGIEPLAADTGFTYAWYKLPNTSTPMSNATGNTLTIPGGYTAANDATYRVTYNYGGCVNRYMDITLNSSLCNTSRTASLGDFVWRDDNQNGVQDAGEPGIAGVHISLYRVGEDGLPGTGDDLLVGSTVTDAYGQYLFDNISPSTSLISSNYYIKVTPPANYTYTTQTNTADYINGAETIADQTGSDVNADGISYAVNVNIGEHNATVDAGLIFTPAPTVNSIGDKVWLDSNADGVQDVGEPGVASVTVTLLDNAGNIVMVTTTDANGHYLFNNVPDGTYSVAFTPIPGTIFTNGGTLSTAAGSVNSDVNTAGLTTAFSITGGGQFLGIDAGLILDPKSSLGDRVWNDLNNNGIQDAGEPGMPGMMMTLKSVGADSIAGTPDDVTVGTTTTNAAGLYLFAGLDPDKYFVVGTVPAGYTVSPIPVAGGSVTAYNNNDFSATAVSTVYDLLVNSDYMGVDMGVYSASGGTATIGDHVWNDLNNDGIQDVGEPGVPGVTVTLLDGSGNPVVQPGTNQPYVVVTDANGNYSFAGLPAGTYAIRFSNLPENSNFCPSGMGTTATDSDPDPVTGITASFTLTAGQQKTDVDAGIVYAASGTATLGDKVWIDVNNNGIQDAGEQGVANVLVTLYASDGTTVLAVTSTDATGTYMFSGLQAGVYVVGFSNLPAGYTLVNSNVGTDDLIDSDPSVATGKTALITVAAGADNLTIDAGVYNSTATNSIGDKVWLDQNNDGLQTAGEPGVAGVSVNLMNGQGTIISSVLTDVNGNYQFGILPDGDYYIQVVAPAGFNYVAGIVDLIDNTNSDIDSTGITTVITVSGNSYTTVDAGLTTTRAALGDYVWYDKNANGIQDATEAGLSGVTVSLYDNTNSIISTTVTDAMGYYLFSNLNQGTYTVGFGTLPSGVVWTVQTTATATGSDVNPVTGMTPPVTLTVGMVNMDVDAGLKPYIPGGISGVVWFDKNADNLRTVEEPLVPGVVVTLKDANDNVIGTTLTDGNGYYIFTDIPSGTGYTVSFDQIPSGANYVTQTVGTTDGSDADPTTGVISNITVTEGNITTYQDAGVSVYVPLPVSLLSFDATAKGRVVLLSWNTVEELDNAGFVIERSNDARHWVNIGYVTSKSEYGASHMPLSYAYIDEQPLSDMNFYRLRIVQLSGAYHYSGVRSVLMNQEATISVYPNPFSTVVRIDGLEQGAMIKVYDYLGRLVQQYTATDRVMTLSLKDLSSGAYILDIQQPTGSRHYMKLIKS